MYPAKFAAVYDRLMEDFDYPAWARYYVALAKNVSGAAPRTVCECGCGTGSMSVELARMGIRVTGVDLSEAMLGLAAEKTRKNGQMIPLVCQDMSNLTLHRPMDAIFCPCDGVNYLLTDEQVSSFFERAFRHIRPGGALVFDVSTPDKLFQLETAPCYEDLEDLTYIWVSRRRGELVDMDLAFFMRENGGLYTRFDEHQTQRAHSRAALEKQLADAGFTGITFYGERTTDDPAPDCQRWHVCALRP